MQKEKNLNLISQFAIPIFTVGGQIAIAMKFPQWGLLLVLLSQPFWLYSSWKSYKKAGQAGILVNTVIFTGVTIFGVLNYWLF
jgi:hypothetical protein